MKIALIDNGSLEPASHRGLRAAAAAVGEAAGARVEAVSWRHSDWISPSALDGHCAWTLAPWVRAAVAAGEREFVLVPFFISPQGAVAALLQADLDRLAQSSGGFDYALAQGLSADVTLPAIVAERVREASGSLGLFRPAVAVVDHGGPSPESARVRNRVADGARVLLGRAIGPLIAVSMESPDGPEFDFNRPLLADVLAEPGFNSGDVLIAPLFLSPGRHAGPEGDLCRIAGAAQERSPGLRCHFTGLVGTHPGAVEALAASLARALQVGINP
jgi:sirohydrochlorin ferrochelatase